MSESNRIDYRQLSPSATERLRVLVEREFHQPMPEMESEELPEIAMRRLRAEAERRGTTIYEVIEWLLKKADV
jgi:hypothetical protein